MGRVVAYGNATMRSVTAAGRRVRADGVAEGHADADGEALRRGPSFARREQIHAAAVDQRAEHEVVGQVRDDGLPVEPRVLADYVAHGVEAEQLEEHRDGESADADHQSVHKPAGPAARRRQDLRRPLPPALHRGVRQPLHHCSCRRGAPNGSRAERGQPCLNIAKG